MDSGTQPAEQNIAATEALSHGTIVLYGALILPLSVGWVTLMMFIPTYYGLDLGLGLMIAGLIIAAGRIFDFITDPLIGHVVDTARGRWAGRKPWIAVGVPLFCVAAALLFIPPVKPGGAYLLAVSCLYFLAYTICDIPHAAMGLELAQETHERTALSSSKAFFLILGGIIGAAIPMIWTDGPAASLPHSAATVAGLSLVILPLFLWRMPPSRTDHIAQDMAQADAAVFSGKSVSSSIKQTGYVLRTDRYIGIILALIFLTMTAQAFSALVSLIYVTHILKMPSLMGLFWVGSGVGVFIGLPIWVLASKRFGKIRTWAVAEALGVVSYAPLFFIGAGDQVIMVCTSFLIGAFGICGSVVAVSILADRVAHVQSGPSRGMAGRVAGRIAGRVAAARNAVMKLAAAVALLTAFPAIEGASLALVSGQSLMSGQGLGGGGEETATLTILFFYAAVPMLLRAAAAGWLWRLRDEDTR